MKIGDVFFEKHTIVKMSSRNPEQWAEADVEEVDAIEIPKNATNGDAIKALFPNIETFEPNKYEIAIKQNLGWLAFKKDWWNAPYKENKQ